MIEFDNFNHTLHFIDSFTLVNEEALSSNNPETIMKFISDLMLYALEEGFINPDHLLKWLNEFYNPMMIDYAESYFNKTKGE